MKNFFKGDPSPTWPPLLYPEPPHPLWSNAPFWDHSSFSVSWLQTSLLSEITCFSLDWLAPFSSLAVLCRRTDHLQRPSSVPIRASTKEALLLLPIQVLSRSVAEGENTVRETCPRSIVVCQKVFRGMTSGFNSSLCSHHRMEQPSASLFLNAVWTQPTFLDEMGLPHPRSKSSSSSRPLFSLTSCSPPPSLIPYCWFTLTLAHCCSHSSFDIVFSVRVALTARKKSKKNPIHAFLFIYSFNSTFFT